MPLIDLMYEFRTGPMGFTHRREIVYERYGVNIFQSRSDEWTSERLLKGNEWLSLRSNEVSAGMLACRVAKSWQRNDGLWDHINGVGTALWGVATMAMIDEAEEEFGTAADPTPDDPSIQDYLTDADSFDSHVGMLSRAVVERRRVSVLYGDRNDEASARIIHPVRVAMLQHMYVLAWDEMRSDWRTFRVDRIKMCTIMESKFAPHEVPLPVDMTPEEMASFHEHFGESADKAMIRLAWSVGWSSTLR